MVGLTKGTECVGEEALAVGCMVSYLVEDETGVEIWDRLILSLSSHIFTLLDRFCCFEEECTSEDGVMEDDFVWNER